MNAIACAYAASLFLSPSTAMASGSACVTGSQVKVCVAWSQGPDPILDSDFSVSFTDPSKPDIVLVEGDLGWIVYAVKLSDDNPADINSLTINPNSSGENFSVKLAKMGTETRPGAANVGNMTLSASSWSGHSSIAAGSIIDGDLTGNLTRVSATFS